MPRHYVRGAVAAVAAAWLIESCIVSAQSPQPKTAGAHPDLQGLWTNSTITPLERPAQFANKEFLTEEEARALDREAASRYDQRSNDAAADIDDAYNQFWWERGSTVGSRR